MKRLLVVDDVPLFRSGLTAALSGAGYDVVGEAADGEKGLDIIEMQTTGDYLILILGKPIT